MGTTLKHIMLMVNDMEAASRFYAEGLGLPLRVSTPMWAELDTGKIMLALHATEDPVQPSNTAILSFYADDIHETIEHLESFGATLEGRVREPSFGKVAAMRAPDGALISLMEPAQHPPYAKNDKETREHGSSHHGHHGSSSAGHDTTSHHGGKCPARQDTTD